MERAERDYHDALRELESSNVRFNEEQDKAYNQLEEAVRAQKRAAGDAEEAKCGSIAARLDLASAQERWDAERRELASTIENLRDALASERAAGSEEASALRARLTDTSSALSRSVAREEDRLAELSRLRIESGMAKQRCEASEKRVRMLQEQTQSFMRRQLLHVTDG